MISRLFLKNCWLLFVLIACKQLDTEVLEEQSLTDGGLTSATIALVDNDLKIILPSDLTQQELTNVKLSFIPGGEDDSKYSVFVLGTAGPDNIASPLTSETISEIHIDILLVDNSSLCPGGSFIVELSSQAETTTDDLVLGQTDVLCAGNPFSQINNLTQAINEMTGSSMSFLALSKEQYGDTYDKAKALIEQQTDSDGFLEKHQNNDLAKKFILHYKMLDAYHKMREKLGFPDASSEIEGGWTDRLYKFIEIAKHHQDIPHGIIIPSVLNGFLNPQVNRVSLGEQIDENEDLATRVSKQALKTAIAKFLHYQYVFDDGQHFENRKFTQDFDSIAWDSDLQEVKDNVVKKITEGHEEISSNAETKTLSKLTVNETWGDLTDKIQELSLFMSEGKENGKECQTVLGEYFHKFATPTEEGGVRETSDALILLNSRHIMHQTGIHQPCKKYGEFFETRITHDGVKKAVIDGKKATLDHIKNLNKNFANRNKNDYLVELLKENYHALVPVLTNEPEQIPNVVNALRDSERQLVNKRKGDLFWNKVLGWGGVVLTVFGIVSSIALFVLAFIFPPIAALGSLVLALSLAGGVTLTAMYGWNYLQEKGNYQKLEREIFSGANSDTSEAARNYSQWRKAKFAAITEGVLTGVAVAGGGLRFIANPQAGAKAVISAPGRAKSYWQGLKNQEHSWARELASRGWGKAKTGAGKAWGVAGHPIKSGKNSWGWLKDNVMNRGAINEAIKSGKESMRAVLANHRETWRFWGNWKEMRKITKAHGGKVRFKGDTIIYNKKGLLPENQHQINLAVEKFLKEKADRFIQSPPTPELKDLIEIKIVSP